MSTIVTLVPYDHTWPAQFALIRNELTAALGDAAVAIEHVGSTSVPGLAAKPVIDIDVVIRPGAFPDVRLRLEAAGYRHAGDQGIAGREVFKCADQYRLPKHHLYVCSYDAAELWRHLTFRNALRSRPELTDEYARVKVEGARLFPDRMDAYIAHKGGFIQRVYRSHGLQYRYEFDALVSPAALADLRQAVGWNRMERDLADPRLRNAFHLCAWDGERLIGYAAVVSNSVTDAYIQDVMVHPDCQGQGVGTQLMERVLARLKAEGMYMVSVIYGEEALRPFYEKFGFFTMLCGQREMRPGHD